MPSRILPLFMLAASVLPAIHSSRELYASLPGGRVYSTTTYFNHSNTPPSGVAQGFYTSLFGVFFSSYDARAIFFLEQFTESLYLVAGVVGVAGDEDGTFLSATFMKPGRLAYDSTAGRLYVADIGTGYIRVLDLKSSVVSHVTRADGSRIQFSTGVQTAVCFQVSISSCPQL